MSHSNVPQKQPDRSGFFVEVASRIRLILRLMADRRVSIFLKIIPVFSLVYLLNPLDIPGPFDDATVIALSLYLFTELCPPELVQEHLTRLRNVVPGKWADRPPASPDDVIDGEYSDLSTKDSTTERDNPEDRRE